MSVRTFNCRYAENDTVEITTAPGLEGYFKFTESGNTGYIYLKPGDGEKVRDLFIEAYPIPAADLGVTNAESSADSEDSEDEYTEVTDLVFLASNVLSQINKILEFHNLQPQKRDDLLANLVVIYEFLLGAIANKLDPEDEE